MINLYKDYLKILEIPFRKPDRSYLGDLIVSHLRHIPFENISKIYYNRKFGLITIPEFELFMEGIIKNNFGGTCYSTNYYFNQLLNYLGFNAILCGADMANPDVHLVSLVNLNGHEFLVDVGYAAPFFEPIPVDLDSEYAFEFGNDRYVLLPKDKSGRPRMNLYRNNTLAHRYIVNPHSRSISEFSGVIENSYAPSATFMNSILLTTFGRDSSTIIRDLSIIQITNNFPEQRKLSGKAELISEIMNNFKMPREIVIDVVESTEFTHSVYE